MNPVRLIKQDHRTVKGLFRKFEKESRRAEKQKIGQEIIEELSIHATIEEQLIYPILRRLRQRNGPLEDIVLNALEEHHAVKLILAELDKMEVGDERYDAKVHVVKESVEMHIEEEESKLLPRLERALHADERKALSEAILTMKHTAPNYPHPGAPDTPPGIVAAGILAKVGDIGKDLLRTVTSEDKAQGHRRVRRRAKAASTKVTRRRTASSSRQRGKRQPKKRSR